MVGRIMNLEIKRFIHEASTQEPPQGVIDYSISVLARGGLVVATETRYAGYVQPISGQIASQPTYQTTVAASVPASYQPI